MESVIEKLEEKIANAGRPYASRIAIGGSPRQVLVTRPGLAKESGGSEVPNAQIVQSVIEGV